MIAERIASLSEVAKVALEEREISYPLRDFPDGFYADPKLHLQTS